MTSEITFPCWVIGLMSGTSADGVDAALLYTDGKTVAKAGASLFVPYGNTLRTAILAAMRGHGHIDSVAHDLTEIHRQAVEQLIATGGVPKEEIKLLGFHGQTILHRPTDKLTVQIGDAAYLATQTGIPVVHDFRNADVQAGGQGAPLVPLYHAALAGDLEKPLMVVNIGGVSNVTYLDGDTIIAFDCGPGNALIDDWVRKHTDARCDEGGSLAASGTVDTEAVEKFLSDPFFALPAPKSLDRNHFNLVIPAKAGISLADGASGEGDSCLRRNDKEWSLEDGAATLTAMTAAAIAEAVRIMPKMPKHVLICGGGRHNPTLMAMLKQYQLPAQPVEVVGWNGDMLEAEAFAYLAARSVQGLPLSLPATTGVAEPMTGGALCEPHSHHHHHDDDDDGDNTSPRSCCR